MLRTLRRSRLARWALAILAFVALGYLSDTLTGPACERSTERWLGGILSRSPAGSPDRRAFSEPATYRLPWIVAVDYEWAHGSTGAEIGTRYYLCLFGIPVSLGNDVREIA